MWKTFEGHFQLVKTHENLVLKLDIRPNGFRPNGNKPLRWQLFEEKEIETFGFRSYFGQPDLISILDGQFLDFS